tara:strand:+ start:1523 stop:2236 length:714 start_codon:yes stop_codon:yes gene_type:complete
MSVFKTFTLLYDREERNIRINATKQYNPNQSEIRKDRSDKKYKGEAEKQKNRRIAIKKDIEKVIKVANCENISILSMGCRDSSELDFLESISEKIKTFGIDLSPSDDKRIFTGNVETMDINATEDEISNIFQNTNIIFSSHNLEHLSDPILHFSNVMKRIKNELVFYYILPCWSGVAGPTQGHPNYIHCTHTQESFTPDGFSKYLSEVTDYEPDVLFTGYDNFSDDLRVCFRLKSSN